MKTAAYQGEPGSYGDDAAWSMGYGSRVGCPSFEDAARLVSLGLADAVVLPVENSTYGSVGGSMGAIVDYGLHITGETYYHVRHCLIGTARSAKRVKTVYSHPQALGQCSRFLAGLKKVPVYDTAGAAMMIKDMKGSTKSSCAAIAGRKAAGMYGLRIIAEDINDVFQNYTRFLVAGLDEYDHEGGLGNYKTTITFTLVNQPGMLSAATRALAGVNLTRIESRPLRNGSFEYAFMADLEGMQSDIPARRALKKLAKAAVSMRVLGTYPAANIPPAGGQPADKAQPDKAGG